MEQTAVFDATRAIALKIPGPDGGKTVRARFPSDEEWTERQRRRKVIVKQLGRGSSETTMVGGEEVDAGLLAKIRTDDGHPAVDQYEASRIIQELSECDIDDVVPAGDAFRISLRVPGGNTTVVVGMPSAKDVTEYRRGFATVLDRPYGRQELTINLRVAGDLFKKLVQAVEGYAEDVPIIHQAAAVKGAIEALDYTFAEDREANFRKGSGQTNPPSAI
jgi:hypothetical protein